MDSRLTAAIFWLLLTIALIGTMRAFGRKSPDKGQAAQGFRGANRKNLLLFVLFLNLLPLLFFLMSATPASLAPDVALQQTGEARQKQMREAEAEFALTLRTLASRATLTMQKFEMPATGQTIYYGLCRNDQLYALIIRAQDTLVYMVDNSPSGCDSDLWAVTDSTMLGTDSVGGHWYQAHVTLIAPVPS